jgi:hypothetical protein
MLLNALVRDKQDENTYCLTRDFRRGRPAGALVLSGAQNTGIRGRLPLGRPSSASLQRRPANGRFEECRDFIFDSRPQMG